MLSTQGLSRLNLYYPLWESEAELGNTIVLRTPFIKPVGYYSNSKLRRS